MWIELSLISQEDDDLFPADGRAALDKLSEEEDYNEVSIFTVKKKNVVAVESSSHMTKQLTHQKVT